MGYRNYTAHLHVILNIIAIIFLLDIFLMQNYAGVIPRLRPNAQPWLLFIFHKWQAKLTFCMPTDVAVAGLTLKPSR